MSEEIDWSVRAPHVKHRHCPSCKAELQGFRLAALQMPIEQFTIPLLSAVNEAIGYSARPWGNQNLHELQQLMFISGCPDCTLISFWDFGVEELQEILREPVHPPFARIAWGYAPEAVKIYAEKAPAFLKPQFDALLKAVLPQTTEDGKTE